MSNSEFAEAFAALLCLPSPACAPRLGQQVVGQARVDRYGDAVVNARMRGDGFRCRHDPIKMGISKLLQWAGVRAECEVFNAFADAIPQKGLNRIERGCCRQGQVPDFKLEGERGGEETLCKLKTMSASVSRYPQDPLPRDGTLGQGQWIEEQQDLQQTTYPKQEGLISCTVGPLHCHLLNLVANSSQELPVQVQITSQVQFLLKIYNFIQLLKSVKAESAAAFFRVILDDAQTPTHPGAMDYYVFNLCRAHQSCYAGAFTVYLAIIIQYSCTGLFCAVFLVLLLASQFSSNFQVCSLLQYQ